MSTSMTIDERILWEYVEDESNELILSLLNNVEKDGFNKLQRGENGVETVALKVVSAAIIKMLAMATEKVGNMDLAGAYLELVPMHVELIKLYTFKALEREIRR